MSTRTNDDRLNIPPESITTIIDKGVRFSGTIYNDTGKSIMIAGEFEGTLNSNGGVIINRGAVVSGNLTANRIRLLGQITKGDGASKVLARESLVIESTGRLEADELSYGGLDLHFGAEIRANVIPLVTRISEDSQASVDDQLAGVPGQGAGQVAAALGDTQTSAASHDNVTPLHTPRVAAAG